VPRRPAHIDNECIEADDDSDDDEEEEEENGIEELPSPSKSSDLSRLRKRRRGNQSSCHKEQRSNDFTQFHCR